jgi:hypothetical protein
VQENAICRQAGKLYLETKIKAISFISIVGEAHNGRQETLEQRDSEREKREVVFVLAIFGIFGVVSKIYTKHKPLGCLYKMCDPFFHEFRVIPSANESRLLYCYTLSTTEAVC